MARDHRRLAAIVSVDVAGYSRLMGMDDSGTLAALKSHRRELIDTKIAEDNGRIVKTTGDGLLLEFSSVVDAVRCAVDVQRAMAERNAGIAPDRRIDFRIGINVGDIIIDGDDIFGDGVNIAARLEALAEPGGICVSRVVRDQVQDKLSFTFEDLGTRQAKNIARPIDVYRVHLEAVAPEAKSSGRKQNSARIQILCVDDHPIVRQGIAGLLAAEPDMAVVAEAANGREAIQQFRAHRPDVTLMDLQMPEMGGLDAIGAIRGEFPDARIIVLTTYAGDAQALHALQAGARGYLLKNALHKELLDTIRAVHAGRKALASEVSFELAEHATDDALTPAEIRVLRLIAQGNANKEIATALTLSEETVKGQVRNILSKLDAKDRTHAAMIGLKRGIIQF